MTPLPCNVRHYFHSHCIEEWSSKQRFCPLCNTAFDLTKLVDFDKKFSIMTPEDFFQPSQPESDVEQDPAFASSLSFSNREEAKVPLRD